jgi:hypothetical protein
MLIGQAITDYNAGSAYCSGSTFPTDAAQVVLSDLAGTEEYCVDAIGTFQGNPVQIALFTTGKKAAEAVAKVVGRNKGRTLAEIFAMELPAD